MLKNTNTLHILCSSFRGYAAPVTRMALFIGIVVTTLLIGSVGVSNAAENQVISKTLVANPANNIVAAGPRNKTWVQTQLTDRGATPSFTIMLGYPTILDDKGNLRAGEKWSNDGTTWNGVDTTRDENGLDMRGNSMLMLDASRLTNGEPGLKLHTKNPNANIDTSSSLFLHSAIIKSNQSFLLIDNVENLTQNDVEVDNGGKLVLSNAYTNNLLVGVGDVIFNANTKKLTVRTQPIPVEAAMPRLNTSLGVVIEGAIAKPFNPISNDASLVFISRALDINYIGATNVKLATTTIEGAAQMGAVAGVQVGTINAASAATVVTNSRTSFAKPFMNASKAVAVNKSDDGNLSLDTGLSAGNGPTDGMKNGLGVWLMPLFQSNNTWGVKAGNFNTGSTSTLGGIALGADYTINEMFRFGAALNMGMGYSRSNGDFNTSHNNFDFWGINLYGGWTMDNIGISADVGYTSSYSKVEQELPSTMQMGNLKSDITSSVWTAGLRGEYKIATENVDIIPHVGVRYMGLTTNGYDVKSSGTIFEVDQSFQSIWTFPVGVAFSKTIETESGWAFRPQVDLTVIPAAGDIKAKSKTRIPGVPGSAEMSMQVIDTVTYDGGLGFELSKDNLTLGLNYNLQVSPHRTGHGVFGTLRYEF